MNLVDLLKWAAGAPVRLPRFDGLRDERLLALLGIEEAELLSLLHRHRLTQRFLHRYQQERPAWCSQTLPANLREPSPARQRRSGRLPLRSGHPPRNP